MTYPVIDKNDLTNLQEKLENCLFPDKQPAISDEEYDVIATGSYSASPRTCFNVNTSCA